MEILYLEIDSKIKDALRKNLLATDALGMTFRQKKFPTSGHLPHFDAAEANSARMLVEIFAEPEAVGRIIKNLIRWARKGLFPASPISIKSISQIVI